MKRSVLMLALGAGLAACGSDSKAGQSTTPAMSEPPSGAPVAETPAEAAAEPVKPSEPPAPTYLHGKWVWFELSTSDVDKAKAFYGELLGWKIDDKEVGGQKYSAVMNGDKEIGLVQALPPDAAKKKLGPAWMGYVSVADVDAAVKTATDKGATVSLPAMDMPGIGRFSVLVDLHGASFGVVTSAAGDDADQEPAVGNFIWMEHLSKDAKKASEAAAFYGAVAGYETASVKIGRVDYTLAKAAGTDRMGFMKAEKSAWAGKFVPYIVVANLDETVKTCATLKGKVLVKPMDIPNVGRIAMLADPQGAVFAVMTPGQAPAGADAPPAKPGN